MICLRKTYANFVFQLQNLLQSSIGPLISVINSTFKQPGKVELDLTYYPNPFFGVQNGTFIDSNQAFLGMADGGEDGEVVPIQPLLVKARNVDVIFAIDATSDSDNYAAGSSLVVMSCSLCFTLRVLLKLWYRQPKTARRSSPRRIPSLKYLTTQASSFHRTSRITRRSSDATNPRPSLLSSTWLMVQRLPGFHRSRTQPLPRLRTSRRRSRLCLTRRL